MKQRIAIALACVAVFAGVLWMSGERAESPPRIAGAEPAGAQAPAPGESAAAAVRPEEPGVGVAAPGPPGDPRLAALAVSPDNDLIEFVKGADGRVIREIDKDAGSPGFGKPVRDYSYSGDKVVALVTYEYLGAQTQITRTSVTYKPDGSVDQYRQTSSHEFANPPR